MLYSSLRVGGTLGQNHKPLDSLVFQTKTYGSNVCIFGSSEEEKKKVHFGEGVGGSLGQNHKGSIYEPSDPLLRHANHYSGESQLPPKTNEKRSNLRT